MKIKEAIDRIKWRIESSNWKEKEKDEKAINEIIDFVNSKQKQQFNNHELFAKIYIHNYSMLNEKYKTNVFDSIPIKEFHKLMAQPLSLFIQRFTDKLNDIEVNDFLFSKMGFSEKHPASISKESKDKELRELSEAIKDPENKTKFLGNVWDYETVQNILIKQINDFLNTYYDREAKN